MCECYLENLRQHEETATCECWLLLLGNLQQPFGKGSYPFGGDIRLHGLEEEGQEHGRLA